MFDRSFYIVINVFTAEALGYSKVVPAFLDPNLKEADMLHGVSFGSAASGYDEYTANISVKS